MREFYSQNTKQNRKPYFKRNLDFLAFLFLISKKQKNRIYFSFFFGKNLNMTSLLRNFIDFFLKPSDCKCCKKKTPDKEKEAAPKVPIMETPPLKVPITVTPPQRVSTTETPPLKVPIMETPPQKVPITDITPPIFVHKTYADASTQTTSDLMVNPIQIPFINFLIFINYLCFQIVQRGQKTVRARNYKSTQFKYIK